MLKLVAAIFLIQIGLAQDQEIKQESSGSWKTYLIVFIVYCCVSGFFFTFPNLLYKKKNIQKVNKYAFDNNKTVHISHRGGSREKLENTIESFQNAYDLKTNVIEMDVCLTKDKKIVVVHDSLLKRMTGVNQHVEEFDYKDLPEIKDVITIDFSVHQEFFTKDSSHKYFPLFEDVLRRFPDARINVEIKTPTEEFLQLLNDLLGKYNKYDDITWGCRPPAYNKRIYEVNPKVNRWFNEGSVIKTMFLYKFGLLPFFDLHENSFQVPVYTQDYHQWKLKEVTSFGSYLNVQFTFFLFWLWTILYGPLITHLKKRGVCTYLWVMNTPEEFQLALKLGATGIMTDSPTLLKEFLIAKNRWIDNDLVK